MNSTCTPHQDTLPHYECGRADDVAFLNVLSESMPECDRKDASSMMNWKEEDTKKDVCYVYCAQKTCHAAKNFMDAHGKELQQRCETVVYLPEGALGMDPSDLVDGKLCHANIAKHNLSKGVQAGCLTCDEAEGSDPNGTSVDVTVDDTPVEATYFETKRQVPEWFQRSGIVGFLPPPFSCDPRYKKTPIPHAPSSLSSTAKVRMDISKTGLPRDALLGYWAADGGNKDEGDILVAEKAYGSFENSGIVQCVDAMCEFDLVPPRRYTTEGKVFKSHFHFTEWLGDRWNLDAKTVDVE